jgi:hypothetical protein
MDDDTGPISLETRMFFVLAAYFGGLWLIAGAVGWILHVGASGSGGCGRWPF